MQIFTEKDCRQGRSLLCFYCEMANTINIPKTHLIMGLSLPLAVLLGYFVAEPLDLGSLAVVVFVLVALSIPLMMKWDHPLLVLSWNAAITPAFVPGRPELWAMVAFIGLVFAVLGRAVSPNARFVIEPSVTWSLLALAAVVVVTGMATGGFGVHTLGAARFGGRRYFYFLAAVAGYFVFTSRRIAPQRAGLYVAFLFLSALTFGLSDLAAFGGQKFDFVWWFLGTDSAFTAVRWQGPEFAGADILRLSNLAPAGVGLFGYLLARFGIRGLLDLTRPWRLLLLLAAMGMVLLSGFRGFVILCALTFALMFYLEGLHRTRYAWALLGVVLLGGVIVLPHAEKLPLVAQRAISFLPGKFDYLARQSADTSVGWRVEMWKEVLPEVPAYLLRGKGWGIDATDFRATVDMPDPTDPLAIPELAGDYHNGPLSILIPFGIYGAVAFIWFLAAGLRVLHRNWKFGNPALRTVNTLLLAAFAARVLFFFFIFGSLHSDMAVFTGLLGLGVALNGAEASRVPVEQPASGMELATEYIKA